MLTEIGVSSLIFIDNDFNVKFSRDYSATDDSYIRKAAVKGKIPYMTTMAAAKATVEAIKAIKKHGVLGVKSLQEFHSEIR